MLLIHEWRTGREAGHVLGPRLDGPRRVGQALELGLELGLLPLQLVRGHSARGGGRPRFAAGFAATGLGFGFGFGGSTTTMRRPRIARSSASSFDVRSAASASTAARIASGADAAASRRLLKTSRSRNNAASAAVRARATSTPPGRALLVNRFSIIRRRFAQSSLAFPEQRPDARVDGVAWRHPSWLRRRRAWRRRARSVSRAATAGVDALDQGRGALSAGGGFCGFRGGARFASEGRAALTMARTTSMLLVSISSLL